MSERNSDKDKTCSPGCCQPVVNLTSIDSQTGSENDFFPPSKAWVSGTISTNAGEITVVKTDLSNSDRIGTYLARWGINRMNFRVRPGLYAAGAPDEKSPVFVSANYKMSFDKLRSQLGGIDAWLLVLDTRGINVWCAAGKGTFGTDEIIRQIENVKLTDIVAHRRIILPQLGAPGVKAHEVKKRSGFRVIYGPVRASDIPSFLRAGMKATAEMRRVKFSFRDRLALIPNDLIAYAKYSLAAAALFFLLSGFGLDIYSADRLLTHGLTSAILILIIYLAGICLPISLLPWLPGRSFSVKGMWIGLGVAAGIAWFSPGS